MLLEQSASEKKNIDDQRLASLMWVSSCCLLDFGLTGAGTVSGWSYHKHCIVEDAEPLVWWLIGMGEQYSPVEELVFGIQALIEKKCSHQCLTMRSKLI